MSEWCERLKKCLLSDFNFVRKDVLMYKDLNRKNIVKLIDELTNVCKTKADEQQLIVFYFSAN